MRMGCAPVLCDDTEIRRLLAVVAPPRADPAADWQDVLRRAQDSGPDVGVPAVEWSPASPVVRTRAACRQPSAPTPDEGLGWGTRPRHQSTPALGWGTRGL
jgi:hypothetical protein